MAQLFSFYEKISVFRLFSEIENLSHFSAHTLDLCGVGPAI